MPSANWTPIYAYIRAKSYGPDEAADLTQSFVAVVLLGCGLFEKVDSTHGNFHAHLIASLRKHLTDSIRQTRCCRHV